jgi:hypothetical protein
VVRRRRAGKEAGDQAARGPSARQKFHLRRATFQAAIAAALAGPAEVGFAQGTPPPAPPPAAGAAASQETGPEIVIIADPAERSSIDRTSYIVRDNAEARSTNMLDLLGQVPAVETSGGRLRLLGRAGVTILVDGKQVADPVAYLRNLQGSQVARIEVISNPSAQFSAQGTAGIINLITRRSFVAGLGGSVTANVSRFGGAELKISPTWSRGSLSASGSLGATRSGSPSALDRERYLIEESGDLSLISAQTSDISSRNDSVNGNLLLGYKLDAKQDVSIAASVQRGETDTLRNSNLTVADDQRSPYRQTQAGAMNFAAEDVSADYRWQGRRAEETLALSARHSAFRTRARNRFSLLDAQDEAGLFQIGSDIFVSTTAIKIDHVRPLGKAARLSLGGQIEHARTDLSTEQMSGSFGPGAGGDFDGSIRIEGSWVEKSVYATYQTSLVGMTVLAGLRGEERRYSFPGNSATDAIRRRHPFPSLHIARPFAKWLDVEASYSRRIAWPSVEGLDPRLRYIDPLTAFAGNPALRPEITDALELKLKARIAGHEVDVAGFLRHTDQVMSQTVEFDDGVLITRSVNLGTRTLRGASLAMRGTVFGALRYSISANLADQQFNLGNEGVRLQDIGPEYGASGRIEYRDGAEGKSNTDRFVLNARYRGPTSGGFYRISGIATADASWSHAWSDQFSSVLTIGDIFGSPRVRSTAYSAISVSRESSRSAGPRITLALTYSLKPPAR